MSTFATIVKFFQDCGLFIYPSLLIMAIGVTIAIERYIFLSRARATKTARCGRRSSRCSRTANSRKCRA